jgi:hypothetical protein
MKRREGGGYHNNPLTPDDANRVEFWTLNVVQVCQGVVLKIKSLATFCFTAHAGKQARFCFCRCLFCTDKNESKMRFAAQTLFFQCWWMRKQSFPYTGISLCIHMRLKQGIALLDGRICLVLLLRMDQVPNIFWSLNGKWSDSGPSLSYDRVNKHTESRGWEDWVFCKQSSLLGASL